MVPATENKRDSVTGTTIVPATWERTRFSYEETRRIHEERRTRKFAVTGNMRILLVARGESTLWSSPRRTAKAARRHGPASGHRAVWTRHGGDSSSGRRRLAWPLSLGPAVGLFVAEIRGLGKRPVSASAPGVSNRTVLGTGNPLGRLSRATSRCWPRAARTWRSLGHAPYHPLITRAGDSSRPRPLLPAGAR